MVERYQIFSLFSGLGLCRCEVFFFFFFFFEANGIAGFEGFNLFS